MRNQRQHEERIVGPTPHHDVSARLPSGRANGGSQVRSYAVGALFLLALAGCVSARATYDPATGVVGLDYSRLGDIEMEAAATRAPDGTMTVSVRSVSQAAALNKAVETVAELAKLGAPVP